MSHWPPRNERSACAAPPRCACTVGWPTMNAPLVDRPCAVLMRVSVDVERITVYNVRNCIGTHRELQNT